MNDLNRINLILASLDRIAVQREAKTKLLREKFTDMDETYSSEDLAKNTRAQLRQAINTLVAELEQLEQAENRHRTALIGLREAIVIADEEETASSEQDEDLVNSDEEEILEGVIEEESQLVEEEEEEPSSDEV